MKFFFYQTISNAFTCKFEWDSLITTIINKSPTETYMNVSQVIHLYIARNRLEIHTAKQIIIVKCKMVLCPSKLPFATKVYKKPSFHKYNIQTN